MMWPELLRILKRRPPKRTPVRDLRPGEMHSVEGQVFAIGDLLVSPLSATPCVSLSVFYQHEGQAPPGTPGPPAQGPPGFMVQEFVSRPRFYVRDESGVVRVDRTGRTDLFDFPYPKKKAAWEPRMSNLEAFRSSFKPIDENEEKLVEELDVAVHTEYLEGWEVVIPQGASVRVEGFVRAMSDPVSAGAGAGFRAAPTILQLGPPPKGAMRITRLDS